MSDPHDHGDPSGGPGAGSTPGRPRPRVALSTLPAGVWVLGFGSLFMDVSSEIVHSLLPVYMTAVLSASVLTVGFVEGAAEATAAFTKVFSGALSDFLGR
ncbi:MAG: MFS transporter, partial [Planctomycetes bacterium]|nr:MFS transporter [Planctomycetota bacterium]